MNEQQLIKLLESAEGTIARLMLEVNRLSKETAVKDLTDEEIDELANKYLYVLNDIPYANDIKDFSRAILQKASEK